jgi:hypothetical protein
MAQNFVTPCLNEKIKRDATRRILMRNVLVINIFYAILFSMAIA